MVLVLDIVILTPVKQETKKRKEIWNGFFPRISWCTLPSCINPLAWIIINPNLIPFGRTHKNYTLTAVSKRVVSSIFFYPEALGLQEDVQRWNCRHFCFQFQGCCHDPKVLGAFDSVVGVVAMVITETPIRTEEPKPGVIIFFGLKHCVCLIS